MFVYWIILQIHYLQTFIGKAFILQSSKIIQACSQVRRMYILFYFYNLILHSLQISFQLALCILLVTKVKTFVKAVLPPSRLIPDFSGNVYVFQNVNITQWGDIISNRTCKNIFVQEMFVFLYIYNSKYFIHFGYCHNISTLCNVVLISWKQRMDSRRYK